MGNFFPSEPSERTVFSDVTMLVIVLGGGDVFPVSQKGVLENWSESSKLLEDVDLYDEI
jgi:hypothetical protein